MYPSPEFLHKMEPPSRSKSLPALLSDTSRLMTHYSNSVCCKLIIWFCVVADLDPLASARQSTTITLNSKCYLGSGTDLSARSPPVFCASGVPRGRQCKFDRATRFRASRDFATTRLFSSSLCPHCICRLYTAENSSIRKLLKIAAVKHRNVNNVKQQQR